MKLARHVRKRLETNHIPIGFKMLESHAFIRSLTREKWLGDGQFIV